jgi:glutathione synthase/RimK-type ligase-like ATP-grasp enzyme
MQYNFVLIRTDKGRKYANKILNSIKWINEHKYPQHIFNCFNFTIGEFLELAEDDDFFGDNVQPENTIIHARCANPRTEWTIELRKLQDRGFKVVNSVDCIELTSNKLACSLHLQGKVNHPKSWEYSRNMSQEEYIELWDDIENSLNPDFVIAKPLTSLEQGANVRKVNFGLSSIDTRWQFNQVPGNKIVIQEYIPYTALHRVIVINGKALPYTFVDYANDPRKNDWKVSCCLNRTTMKLNENPSQTLLKLAEDTQKAVNGVINFIDIFQYNDDVFGRIENTEYTNAEINTACSLNIHEKLARDAGRSDWNIHFRIGKCLVEKLIGE